MQVPPKFGREEPQAVVFGRQFGIRHVLLLTVAAACLLAVGRTRPAYQMLMAQSMGVGGLAFVFKQWRMGKFDRSMPGECLLLCIGIKAAIWYPALIWHSVLEVRFMGTAVSASPNYARYAEIPYFAIIGLVFLIFVVLAQVSMRWRLLFGFAAAWAIVQACHGTEHWLENIDTRFLIFL